VGIVLLMKRIFLLVLLLSFTGSVLPKTVIHSHTEKRDHKMVSKTKMDSNSWLKRGLNYKNGTGGVKVDKHKAAALVRMAADMGNKAAQLEMENMYKHGIGVKKDLNKAKYWCERAKRNNHAVAAVRRKVVVRHNKNIASTHTGSYKSSEKRADEYFSGKGAPRNLEEAYRWYLKAAAENSSYAAYMLSVMYQLGRGVEQSLSKTVYWYKVGSSRKDALEARMRVAANFEKGYGVPKDLIEAAKWYERVSAYKVAKAQNALGDLYSRNGTDVQNYKVAIMWYYMAAKQNYAMSQYNLGLLYLDGKGIKKNPRKAAYWFKKAAYQKVRPAQYELGKMYFDGVGVKQNNIRAYAWLDIALRNQNDATPEMIDILINDMEPKTREMALELTRRYESRYMLSKI
jgi:uncharacterized protein